MLNIRSSDNVTRFLFPALIFWLIVLTAVFFFAQLNEAVHKPLWGDEVYGLQTSVRADGFASMLVRGVPGQGSPAPLDYLALKCLDRIREPVSYFGLHSYVYYRLWANSATALSIIFVVLLFAHQIYKRRDGASKPLQIILLGFVPVIFLFSRMVYYYAAEMRPYALWDALWFIVLAVSLSERRTERGWIVVLILLALSATTSVFQIGVTALSYGIVRLINGRPFKETALDVLKIFGLPLLIVFNYCLRVGEWGEHEIGESWPVFWKMWAHESVTIPLMLGAIALCFFRAENRKYAVAPLSVLFIYLIGPLIFFVTKLKGFFFADRQYIYYDLTNAIFLLTLIQCLPGYAPLLKKRAAAVLVLSLVLLVGAAVAFRPKVCRKMAAAFHKAGAVLADPALVRSSETMMRY